jgi:hypothetical protein
MGSEVDSDGNLKLINLWPCYIDPIVENNGILVILEDIHCDKMVSNLD